jgi:MtfA peptidase
LFLTYLLLGLHMFEYLRRKSEEKTLKKFEIPDELWREAMGILPFLTKWPDATRNRLRVLCTLFLVEKNIVSGHTSLEVTPLMRVVIAAQACALIVHRTLVEYKGFNDVVVHPDSFPATQDYTDEAGVVHSDVEPIAGEAWEDGPVLLSWPDVWESVDFEASGMNLVIHEFAHKIDMRNGEANGVPPLETREDHARWTRALADSYANFCARIDADEPTQIDPYASEHESEFFAVCAEIYVAAPQILRDTYPVFYREMNRYFKLWEA